MGVGMSWRSMGNGIGQEAEHQAWKGVISMHQIA